MPSRMFRFSGSSKHVAHKALVDFQNACRQPLEIGQRGIAGAKIVQCKRHTDGVTGIQNLRGLHYILQRACLQHFDLKAEGFDARVCGEQATQPIHKIRAAATAGRPHSR